MRPTVDALAAALYDYLGKAPPVVFKLRGGREHKQAMSEQDLDIVHFQQSWPNTACMFTGGGGMSGQAFTNAWTTVISHGDDYAVYCDGRRAYGVKEPNKAFLDDLANKNMADQVRGSTRYNDEG